MPSIYIINSKSYPSNSNASPCSGYTAYPLPRNELRNSIDPFSFATDPVVNFVTVRKSFISVSPVNRYLHTVKHTLASVWPGVAKKRNFVLANGSTWFYDSKLIVG